MKGTLGSVGSMGRDARGVEGHVACVRTARNDTPARLKWRSSLRIREDDKMGTGRGGPCGEMSKLLNPQRAGIGSRFSRCFFIFSLSLSLPFSFKGEMSPECKGERGEFYLSCPHKKRWTPWECEKQRERERSESS